MDRADVAIEQWARERPDLPSLPMAVPGRLSDAAERVMRDHMNPLFAAAGPRPGEFDVLTTLRRFQRLSVSIDRSSKSSARAASPARPKK